MGVVHFRVAREQLDTTFDWVVSTTTRREKRARSVLLHALLCIRQLEEEISETLPQSAVARLNAGTPDEPLPVPTSVLELLVHGAEQGIFSPDAFGWDLQQGLAWRRSDTKLSFSPLAQNYALEMVRNLLTQEGFGDYRLSAGRSHPCLSGSTTPEIPWRWDWIVQRVF